MPSDFITVLLATFLVSLLVFLVLGLLAWDRRRHRPPPADGPGSLF